MSAMTSPERPWARIPSTGPVTAHVGLATVGGSELAAIAGLSGVALARDDCVFPGGAHSSLFPQCVPLSIAGKWAGPMSSRDPAGPVAHPGDQVCQHRAQERIGLIGLQPLRSEERREGTRD